MRRRTAGLGAEAHHLRPVQRGGVRRREVLGDEDRPRRGCPPSPGAARSPPPGRAGRRRARPSRAGRAARSSARRAGPRSWCRPAARRTPRSCPCRSRSRRCPAGPGRAGSPGARRRSSPCPRRPRCLSRSSSASSWTMDRSMASLSRRRSRCRSVESSLTSKSSWRTCRTVPDAEAGRGGHPQQDVRILGASGSVRRGRGRSGNHAGPRGLPRRQGRRPPRPGPPESARRAPRPPRGVRTVRDDLHLVAVPTSIPMIAITLLAFAWSSPRLSEMSLSYFARGSTARPPDGRAGRPGSARGSRRRSPCDRSAPRAVDRAVPRAAANVASAMSSTPAVTRPARGVNDGSMSELAITIWVSRLFALVATASRSKVMSSSPAWTWSPTFTLAVKPSPFMCTVSSPMWVSTSRSPRARMVRACAAGWMWMTSPSHGATRCCSAGRSRSPHRPSSARRPDRGPVRSAR